MATYTITGASGNIGHVIVEKLIDGGHTVRAVARNEERLKPLAAKGAKVFAGTLEDAGFLTHAYRGADAVFAMVPPNLETNDYFAYVDVISKAHVKAIKDGGVKNVVALSSIGAHLGKGAGVVDGLHHFERDLETLTGVNVLVLRPSYFMDNLYMQARIIKTFGIAGSPVAGSVRMPVVYTRDIGEFAAKRLADLAFSGHAVEYVLGERDISYDEITRVLGKAVGRPDLKYVQFPADQAVAGMTQMGISAHGARLLVELADGINNGRVLTDFERTPVNTTPTSIEEFAKSFAQVYNS